MQRIRERLVALFLVGVLLFDYPLVHLFVPTDRVWGIPVLLLYLFISWGVLIALVALVLEQHRTPERDSSHPPGGQ